MAAHTAAHMVAHTVAHIVAHTVAHRVANTVVHKVPHMAPNELQTHYGNGFFDNVYLLILDDTKIHWEHHIAVTGVVDHLGYISSTGSSHMVAQTVAHTVPHTEMPYEIP